MNRLISIILFLTISNSIFAQNPIVPAGVYIADPSARVWDDGKLYIYGSLDESCDYYCSWRHHVMATSDLNNWQIYEDRFSSKGKNDVVPYNESLLFAPDCAYKDGKYYLYFCQPDLKYTEGVAIADNPTGPFKKSQNINLHGHNQIDPAVFIDDDGQAYYVWGQFTLKIAKLKPNMGELDPTTIKDSILTESKHFFHEGAFLTKQNGTYYLVYADMSRGNAPTCIGYSTSTSLMGPYTYRGVIVDNNYCNPNNWNNHGSIAEFNGQWYVFYHRSTHACNKMRKACMEPIRFLKDGSIPEVEMTSQGANGPLNAFEQIDAERACLLFGNVRIQAFEEKNEELGGIQNSDKVAYKYLDFGEGASSITIRVAPGAVDGKIGIALDQPWHPSIGMIDIPSCVDGKKWKEFSIPIKPIQGKHSVWLTFQGDDGELFQVDWLKFNK